jgi:hypothetical protein
MSERVTNTNDMAGAEPGDILAALARAGVSSRGDASPESGVAEPNPGAGQEPEPEGGGEPPENVPDAGEPNRGAAAPTSGEPEPGVEGGPGEGAPKPEPTPAPPPAKGLELFQLPELQAAQQAREQLRKLEAQETFYDAFLGWAKGNPEGGRCVIHGQDIGEFTAEQVSQAVEGVQRKLNGVEFEKRLAAQRAEEHGTRAMQQVTSLAKAIAPGIYVQGHVQQQLAATMVQSIPESVRRQMQDDPVANLVLALAVRGASTLANAQSRKPAPPRSVTPTGAAGNYEVEDGKRTAVARKMAEELVKGRGNVDVLAALLR